MYHRSSGSPLKTALIVLLVIALIAGAVFLLMPTIRGVLINLGILADDTKEPDSSIPSYVVYEADRVSDIVKSKQSDSSFTFFAITDTHENQDNAPGNQSIGMALSLIRDAVEIDFAALMGDITVGDQKSTIQSGLQEIEAVNRYFEDGFSGIPNFRTTGNHDTITYSFDQNQEYLSNEDLFPYIGRYNVGAVYGDTDGGYCYRDFDQFKTRVINLNTTDMDGVEVTENSGFICMSGPQIQWFAESLDLSEKKDADQWGILILSHAPLDYQKLLNSAGKVLDAYLNGISTSFEWEGTDISYDYAGKNQAQIIANIHGHNHCLLVDNMYITNQLDLKYQSSIKRICIPNACFNRNNERGEDDGLDSNNIEFGEVRTYKKTADTAENTAFNVVTIDTKTKTIYCTNYGAGYDREISYAPAAKAPAGRYKNQIPEAEYLDEENQGPLDGVGYRDGSYISTRNIYGVDEHGVITGAMPYNIPSKKMPPTIYIWGAHIDESDHVRFFIRNSDKSDCILYAAGKDISKYFTIEQMKEDYYKLTPTEVDGVSTLYDELGEDAKDCYIAWSLIGQGKNLVISFDAPITG